MTKGKVVPEGAVVGHHLNSGLVVANGFRKMVEVDVRESAELVTVGKIGIATNGLCAVENGTRIVVEVELRHATVEVGFVEVGLVVDDEVEIADGKHVVVVCQRIAGNVHHAVGVNLGIAPQPPKGEG